MKELLKRMVEMNSSKGMNRFSLPRRLPVMKIAEMEPSAVSDLDIVGFKGQAERL
jgi:hypothetical protein